MTDANVISGTYADLRQVKSRGVWQLVIDVPAEYAERLVKLFGLPKQDQPTHLAVAQLKGSPEALDREAQGRAVNAGTPASQASVASGETVKRQRTLPELVGMRCNDGHFITWLLDCGYVEGPDDSPAIIVRRECGVASRSEILPGTEAAERWNKLETQYLMKTGRMAEPR